MDKRIEASLEGQLFSRTGSFWTTVFAETENVRSLLETSLRTNMLGQLDQIVRDFSGQHNKAAWRRHVSIGFDSDSIAQAGMQTYGLSDSDVVFGNDLQHDLVYGQDRVQYWVLPLDSILPLAIQSLDRLLLLGVDFFVQADRWLYFRQDPRTLFPDHRYLVTRGVDLQHQSAVSFFTQVNVAQHEDVLVSFTRQWRTPAFFRRAMAIVGGAGWLRYGGVLRGKFALPNKPWVTHYVFDQEIVQVDYDHTPLEIGSIYPADMIVGDVLRVLLPVPGKVWWRQVDWKGGLSLDPLLPAFPGLSAVDTWAVAYPTYSDAGSVDGSKAHARIQLSGNYAAENRYWEQVAINETNTGCYLNSVLGLPDDPDRFFEKMVAETDVVNQVNQNLGLPQETPAVQTLPTAAQVNVLDVFFLTVLQQVGLVIYIDQTRLRNIQPVCDFLRREMPVDACPIVFGTVTGIVDNEHAAGQDWGSESKVYFTDLLFVSITDAETMMNPNMDSVRVRSLEV